LTRKLVLPIKSIFIFIIFSNLAYANIQENLINKFLETETLIFSFTQKIADNEEFGECYVKYPLLMKCNYKNVKQKSIIANGKTVAIIKKKYKKIYYYPIKSTPLFIILDKEKILNLIKNTKPIKTNSEIIEFEYIDEKSNKLNIFFDKYTLGLKGWKTRDSYSNEVNFLINDLKINNQIVKDFFKIPKEEDL